MIRRERAASRRPSFWFVHRDDHRERLSLDLRGLRTAAYLLIELPDSDGFAQDERP